MKAIIVVALIIVAVLSFVMWLGYSTIEEQAQNQTTQTDSAKESNQDAYPSPQVALKFGIVRMIAFIHDYREEIVATGTFVMAIFTVVLGLATVFLYSATRDLVENADQTAQRQLRAYVFVKDAFVRNIDGPDRFAVHTYLKNFGQTPAYRYSVKGAAKYTPFPNTDFSRDPKGDQRVLQSILAPGGESAFVVDLPLTMTDEIKAALKSGQTAIYSFGIIEYDDAFKKHHTANFRFMFGGDAGTRTIEREGIRLGAMAQTTEGNTADDH